MLIKAAVNMAANIPSAKLSVMLETTAAMKAPVSN
jgi:hypothetical protein